MKEALAELRSPSEAPSRPQPAPEPPEPAPTPVGAPRQSRRASTAPAPSRPEPSRPDAGCPAERRRALIAGWRAPLGVVAVVLLAIALIGGGSDSGSDDARPTRPRNSTAAEDGKVTQAVLAAADGSDASGRAVFGRSAKKKSCSR